MVVCYIRREDRGIIAEFRGTDADKVIVIEHSQFNGGAGLIIVFVALLGIHGPELAKWEVPVAIYERGFVKVEMGRKIEVVQFEFKVKGLLKRLVD